MQTFFPCRCHVGRAPGAGAVLLSAALSVAAADWPNYRGPARDGVSTDRIVTNWSGSVTNPVWLVPVTNSFSSFAVNGGRAYSQVNRFLNGTHREVCVALSITNGAELWARDLDDAYYPIDTGVGSNDGPRTTPAVIGESVYVLTSYLKLYRLAATNGATIWQKDLLGLYGGVLEDNQNSASPVIEDGLIFVNTCAGTTVLGGVGVSNLMAFSTTNGALAWRSRNENMTLSTPTIATIHGVRQIIFATRTGVVSLNPTNGAFLWKFNYPFTVSSGAELIVSPVVYQDTVFIMGPRVYLMGAVAYRVNFTNATWSTTQLWVKTGGTPANDTVGTWWTTPVVLDGFLYGQIGNQATSTGGENNDTCPLKCVDIQTGTIKWATNNFGRGGVLIVNQQLVVITEKGALVLVRPNTNAYTELGRFQAIPGYDQNTNKCWNSPAVADGKIYIRSTYFGALYDLSVPPTLPDLVTLGSSNVTATAAILFGSVNPNGSPTTASFQWGLTSLYGSNTLQTVNLTGVSSILISNTLSGLTPATTYHFNFVAANSAGATNGTDLTFTTTPSGPLITNQPKSRAAVVGGGAVFTVGATSPPTNTYQWHFFGTNALPSQTNATLVITNVQETNFGAYSVLVNNSFGSVTSAPPANLTRAVQPSIANSFVNFDTFFLAFPTEFGPIYLVEYKSTLTDQAWLQLTNVNGSGLPITVTDIGIATNTARFFRMRLQ